MSLVVLEDIVKKKFSVNDQEATKISKVIGEYLGALRRSEKAG